MRGPADRRRLNNHFYLFLLFINEVGGRMARISAFILRPHVHDERVRALTLNLECGGERILSTHYDVTGMAVSLVSNREFQQLYSTDRTIGQRRMQRRPSFRMLVLERRLLKPIWDRVRYFLRSRSAGGRR